MTPCVICDTPTKNKTCATDECRRALKNQQQREARAAGIIWGQHPYNCIRCGKQCKSAKRDAKYCSMYCYNMLRYDTCGRVPTEDLAHNKRRRERDEAKANGTYVYPMRLCSWCDHMYTPTQDQGHRCPDCKGNRQGAKWQIFHRDCAICEKPYVTRYTKTTCSDTCARIKYVDDRRESEHKRRARKTAAFVAPVNRQQVYKRDGYRCHICGGKAKMDAVVPHPKAPTLDHVIPLARGGTHEPLNCRLAHFMCNALKGDRLAGDQMLLIA